MRILAGGRVLFIGQPQCPEFDCPQEPLPGKLKVLLCLVDGAERRRQIQAQLSVLHPRPRPANALGTNNLQARIKRALFALWLIGAIVYTTNGATAQPVETASIEAEQVEVHSVVVDTPQVISLSYASPETWANLPSSVQLDEQLPATGQAAQTSPDLNEIELQAAMVSGSPKGISANSRLRSLWGSRSPSATNTNSFWRKANLSCSSWSKSRKGSCA